MRSKYFYNKGFTLIELLVVIAIISLLSSIVLASLNLARGKSRDTRRLSDMKQIQIALELYRDSNDQYPRPQDYNESDGATCGGWDTSRTDQDGDGKFFIEPLQDGKFIATVPRDLQDPPSSVVSCGNYDYYRYSAGSFGCDTSRGDFYILGIRDMETSDNPHPQSPGWNCPSRVWQGEFDWVTGGFTN